MKKKFTVYSLQFTGFTVGIVLFLLFLLSPITYNLQPLFAQSCGSITPYRATGLVTTTSLIGQFGTTGGCIIDTKASFAPFKIPTYDDLKSTYYTQSKATKVFIAGDATQSSLNFTVDSAYNITGNLNLSGNATGTNTGVVFVDGSLNINSNYTYGTALTGTVFVVRGDVNISYTPTLVTTVNAVIISQGIICTAYDGVSCPGGNVTTSQLTINGSLISLNESTPIKFRRSLGASNATTPAEIINHQPKYLVILKTIFSDTLQKWSEISGNEPIPTQPPATVPDPPTGVNAIAGNASATVTWTAPFDGRSPIIDYTVTPSRACASCTGINNIAATSTTVGGLTNGLDYTFTVRARNSEGFGPASAASNSVTPQPPCPTGFRDADLDSFTVGGPQTVCPGPGLPSGWRSTASAQPDCYDLNANARPSLLVNWYFTTARGTLTDSGGNLGNYFDFNCDGVETKNPDRNCTATQAITSCTNERPSGVGGYSGTIPACGASATIRYCVSYADATCITDDAIQSSCINGCPGAPPDTWEVYDGSALMACR